VSRLGLAPLLLIAGCLDGPFAPPPENVNCGSEAHPCPLACDLDCAGLAATAAGACMLTLEGTLSADRLSCDFADGSEVRFADPLPAGGAAQAGPDWDLTLRRHGADCLHLEQPASDEQGELRHSRMSLTGPAGSYRQELWTPSSARDGGPPARRMTIRCLDGRIFTGEGLACGACNDGGCGPRPFLELEPLRHGSLELRLRGGSAVTPLFTCR